MKQGIRKLIACLVLLALCMSTVSALAETVKMWTNEEIDIRDSYVLTYDGMYYLYGTYGFKAFAEDIPGYRVYVGTDLENWEGPYEVFANDGTVWATHRYWAPEVYEVDGKFYFFSAWSDANTEQQLCVLTADHPLGPWTVLSDRMGGGNDPTLYQENGKYYLLYNDPFGYPNMDKGCFVSELSDDFSSLVGERTKLFNNETSGLSLSMGGMPEGWETFVTPTGRLIIMWSGQRDGYYCSSLAYLDDGLFGAIKFNNQFFTPFNMGHNNFFYSLDGQLMMCTHYPNDYSNALGCSSPLFFKVNYDEANDTLVVDTTEFYEKFGDEYNAKFDGTTEFGNPYYALLNKIK